jgi:hypothetical protein
VWFRWVNTPRASLDQWSFSDLESLAAIHQRVSRIMSDRLRNQLCAFLIDETDEHQQTHTQEVIDTARFYSMLDCERVRDEINAQIFEAIYDFIPELEKKHRELVREIQQHEGTGSVVPTRNMFSLFWYLPHRYSHPGPWITRSEYIRMQEEALLYEVTLTTLRECSQVVDKLRQMVLGKLYEAIVTCVRRRKEVEKEIDELRQSLSFACPLKTFLLCATSIRQRYWTFESHPFQKHQWKNSKRRSKS